MSTRISGEKGEASNNAAESIHCFRRKKGDITSDPLGDVPGRQ